jgi:hypothetical protein
MNGNFVGNIYGRYSIKFVNFVRTFHRCFLSCFGSFGKAVSEEKFLEIDQSETRTACGCHVC